MAGNTNGRKPWAFSQSTDPLTNVGTLAMPRLPAPTPTTAPGFMRDSTPLSSHASRTRA